MRFVEAMTPYNIAAYVRTLKRKSRLAGKDIFKNSSSTRSLVRLDLLESHKNLSLLSKIRTSNRTTTMGIGWPAAASRRITYFSERVA